MAPPIKYHLDPDRIADLAEQGYSADLIATELTPREQANRGQLMDHSVLERRYAPALKAGRNRMKGQLWYMLLSAAKAGDKTILIFLAKTVLGLRERTPLEDMVLPEGVTGDMPGVTTEKPYTERGVVLWLREVMPSIERVTREVEAEVQPDLPPIRELSQQELEQWK
jgi:hypothetical protein